MGRPLAIAAVLGLLTGCAVPHGRMSAARQTEAGSRANCRTQGRSCYQVSWDRLGRALCCGSARCGETRCQPDTRDSQSSIPSQLTLVAKSAAESVVNIRTELPAAESTACHQAAGNDANLLTGCESGGTGVVIDADGLILTNEHVVRHAQRVVVVMPNGSAESALCVHTDQRRDLAVIRVSARGLSPARLAAAVPTTVGAPVVALSRADSATPIVRAGMVTRIGCSIRHLFPAALDGRYDGLVETSVPLEPGCSGGPLIDEQGCVIGLNVAVVHLGAARQARGYAIPFDSLAITRIDALVARARMSAP